MDILRVHFLYKSELSSFSLDSFGFVNFWHQNIGKKGTRKMYINDAKKLLWQRVLPLMKSTAC